MSRRLPVILVVFLLLIGLSGCKALQPAQQKSSIVEESVPSPSSEAASQKSPNRQQSRYVQYTPDAFLRAAASRRVLFFYANWCPTCEPANEQFEANTQQIPGDVTVIRVNYNDTDTDQSEKDLAKKYAITYQHTYVQVDVNGKEVSRWTGGGLQELLDNLK